MREGGGRSSVKTNAIRCSYCQRIFARAEHLARHERSHRNEKPFKCNYCESTFTRKDVIKRHNLRYHLDVLEPGAGGVHTPRQTPVSELDPPEPSETAVIPSFQHPPAPSSLPTTSSGYMSGQIAEIIPPDVAPEVLGPVDSMSALLPGMDFNFSWDTMLVEDNIWGFLPFEDTNPGVNVSQFPALSHAPESNRPDWKGSCEISPTKRIALERDIQATFAQSIELPNLNFPSCLTFERLLTGCLENFISQVPCLHIPTWRAEVAHSCLLLSMAALSACCNGEMEIAKVMYCAGRNLVNQQLDSHHTWRNDQPVWLMQSVLILMAYGSSGADGETFNEALSWASLLANLVRRQKLPRSTTTDFDPSLQATWKQWIDHETAVRTRCASFFILNNMNICFSLAPPLLNEEMNDARLPCRDFAWTSSTPEKWMEAWKDAQHYDVSFAEAFEYLLSPSEMTPRNISRLGAYVILHAILQRIWRYSPHLWATMNTDSNHYQILFLALKKWQLSWDEDDLCRTSSLRASNASALLQLAHIRLHTDFSPVRSAVLTLSSDKISQSMQAFSIKISRSESALKTAAIALQSLRKQVKMGMTSRSRGRMPVHGFHLHLVSIECCLFASAWMKKISSIPEHDRMSGEAECVRLVEEIIEAVEVDQVHAQQSSSYSVRLIYAWVSVLECCACWGIEFILAEALLKFANSQT